MGYLITDDHPRSGWNITGRRPSYPQPRPQAVRWRTTFVLARSMSSSPRPDNTVRVA